MYRYRTLISYNGGASLRSEKTPGRKPTVPPEKRREWLRRVEEGGESPPEIAKTDGYDVRTVRKFLEQEQQDREMREARGAVLRNALERHYADLCDFASKLDTLVGNEDGSLALLRDDRMWPVLREHLPRSPIWKNLDRWESLRKEIDEKRKELFDTYRSLLVDRSGMEFVDTMSEDGLFIGTVQALMDHSKATAKGEPPLLDRTDFTLNSSGDGWTQIQLGNFPIGRVLDGKVTDVKDLVVDRMGQIDRSNEQEEFAQLYKDLKRATDALRDDLAIIIFKRIVPGRCKYCPL